MNPETQKALIALLEERGYKLDDVKKAKGVEFLVFSNHGETVAIRLET